MPYPLLDFLHPGHDERPCIVGGSSLDYGTLRAQIQRVSAHLQDVRASTPRARRVVLACRGRATFVAGLFGAWQAGLPVELPPDGEATTMKRLQADAEVVTLLHDSDANEGGYLPTIASAASTRPDQPWRTVDDDDELVHLHTSGTTSAPRRFVKRARALLGEATALFRTFERSETFLSTVPAQHLYGLLFGILLPLRHGSTLVDQPVSFPGDIVQAMSRYAVSTLVSTPAHLRSLAALPRALPRGLIALTSGAPLPSELHAELIERLGWTVHDVFGSTETGGIASRHHPNARWRPLSGVNVQAEEGSGRMLLRSSWSSVAHAEDRIEVSDDGSFEHLGRTDHVVKIAGKRLELRAMERLLEAMPTVNDVAVLAIDDPLRGKRVVAFVVPTSDEAGAELTSERVREHLAPHYEALLLPRKIVVLPRLPREANGKLPRSRLEALLRAPPEAGDELLVHDQLPALRGHFPGHPILPGAALLGWVTERARTRWADLGALVGGERVRFQRPVVPRCTLRLSLERRDDRVHFEVTQRSPDDPAATATAPVVAQGRLEFAGSKTRSRSEGAPT